MLDPAVTPTPEPTPSAMPAPQPTYPGFSASPIFQGYFDTDCAEGEFVSKYGSRWALYNDGCQGTSKKGRCNTKNISVAGGVATIRLFIHRRRTRAVSSGPRSVLHSPRSTAALTCTGSTDATSTG